MESDRYCCQICGDKADVLEYEKAYMNIYKSIKPTYFVQGLCMHVKSIKPVDDNAYTKHKNTKKKQVQEYYNQVIGIPTSKKFKGKYEKEMFQWRASIWETSTENKAAHTAASAGFEIAPVTKFIVEDGICEQISGLAS